MIRQHEGAEQLGQRAQSTPLVVGKHGDIATLSLGCEIGGRGLDLQSSAESFPESGKEAERQPQRRSRPCVLRSSREHGEPQVEWLSEAWLAPYSHQDVTHFGRADVLDREALEKRDAVLLHREAQTRIDLRIE